MRASTFQSVQNGLRIITGDRRVSSCGVWLVHQRAMHSGAGAFVQALMERYTGRQTRWSSLDLVFTQRSPGMTMSPVYHQVQMHVAPHLNLTIQGETHIRHQQSIERVERTLREQLVHYLSARGTRIDAVATRGASTDLPRGWPVSTVVRRPVSESAPDNRWLPAATTPPRPGSREAAHAGADQPPSPVEPWAAAAEARLPLAPRRDPAVLHSPPDAQGAIAKLIEHTAQPVTLSGLELRLVSPKKLASGTRHPAEVAQDERQTTAATPPQPAATALPLPPALDINAISEKVYDRLLRRQQFERERRGLY